jgi:hypothetical protein
MTSSGGQARLGVGRLILLPAVITLAVTLLRLAGELAQWSKTFFNPEPGGAWALVGIVWLVPIFGVYFALKLAAAEDRPPRMGRAIGMAALGFFLLAAGFAVFQKFLQTPTGLIVMWAFAAAGAALQWAAWKSFFKTQLAYAYAARLPVAALMAVATGAGWSSHYTAVVPGESRLETFILFGFFPQLVWWVSFTVIVGSLFGTVAAAIVGHLRSPEQVARRQS